jgi:DNA repair protein RadC
MEDRFEDNNSNVSGNSSSIQRKEETIEDSEKERRREIMKIFSAGRKGRDVSSSPTVDDLAGHRERARQRFRDARNSLGDYELLELLLFLAIPRRDTKTLAKLLLRTFGSLGRVISADPNRLRELKGAGAAVIDTIGLVHEILLRLLKHGVEETNVPLLDSPEVVDEYCRQRIGNLAHEELLVLFVNAVGKLIHDEVIEKGDRNSAPVNIINIIASATRIGAAGIMLVHNHPSGVPIPSQDDIETTWTVTDVLGELKIEFLEHIVVTESKVYRFLGNLGEVLNRSRIAKHKKNRKF